MSESLIRNVIYGALALGVLFLMIAQVVLPFFNTSYQAQVVGLSSTTLQGILLIILLTALIGMIVRFVPQARK